MASHSQKEKKKITWNAIWMALTPLWQCFLEISFVIYDPDIHVDLIAASSL